MHCPWSRKAYNRSALSFGSVCVLTLNTRFRSAFGSVDSHSKPKPVGTPAFLDTTVVKAK